MIGDIRLKCFVEPVTFFDPTYKIIFYSEVEGISRSVAQPLTLTEYRPGQPYVPTLRLDPEQAQRLMDQLYEAGIRPTQGLGSVGQIEAVRAHLADMRKIAFQGLCINET